MSQAGIQPETLAIETALRPFSFRDREIVRMYLGVEPSTKYSTIELARVYRMSEPAVHEVIRRAFQALAQRMAG